MVDDYTAVHADVNHVERVQAVLHVEGKCVLTGFQHEDDTFGRVLPTVCHGMESVGRVLHVGIVFHVGQQVEAELVKPQIHD